MVQTVQKLVKFLHAFLDLVVLPAVARQEVVQTLQKTVKFPLAFLDLFIARRLQRQVPDGRDSAENCGVSAVGALLDKVVDVPVLATSWGCRGSAVAVHRLVSAHHGYDELVGRLFRAVYTGTRPGF